MKILLVTDQFYSANNGMTMSARRFAEAFERHGNEVRVVSTGKEGDTPYLMKKQGMYVFDKLVTRQGMTFAKVNETLLTQAIEWAQVVHFITPFALSRAGAEICMRLGKPYTCAFHVQPENVSSSIHLGKSEFVNDFIYDWFNHYFYRYNTHIHCPSRFIASELEKHGYEAKLHVISNGIDPDFVYAKKPKPAGDDRFTILTTGRYSAEKRQDVLIRAAKVSKYSDRIRVILAGQGPKSEKLSALAEKLGVDVTMKFYTKQELLDVIATSDLYAHCADAEIEAMACMEAFAAGLVPVIANSPKSATPQFALDERSLFDAGDPYSLAAKIDYWIEHPVERAEQEIKYAQSAKEYSLDDCAGRCEKMFLEAINENAAEAKYEYVGH